MNEFLTFYFIENENYDLLKMSNENLLDQIDGWRKKHDRNFTIGR